MDINNNVPIEDNIELDRQTHTDKEKLGWLYRSPESRLLALNP